MQMTYVPSSSPDISYSPVLTQTGLSSGTAVRCLVASAAEGAVWGENTGDVASVTEIGRSAAQLVRAFIGITRS